MTERRVYTETDLNPEILRVFATIAISHGLGPPEIGHIIPGFGYSPHGLKTQVQQLNADGYSVEQVILDNLIHKAFAGYSELVIGRSTNSNNIAKSSKTA